MSSGSKIDLSKLVKIAGKALQEEDKRFRDGLKLNQECPGQSGGVLRIINERYYQFVVARDFSAQLPFFVRVEDEHRDLTLSHSENSGRRFAVIEMKCWMSATGNKEMHGIRDDIKNLQADIGGFAEHGYLIIFSANPSEEKHDAIDFLANKLGTTRQDWELYFFNTVNSKGESIEFWVAGCDAKIFHS